MTADVACDLDAEASVLGAILAAGSYDVEAGHRTLDAVYATGLESVDFYVKSNGKLFAELVRMRLGALPLDPITVADWLEQNAGGSEVLGRARRLAYQVAEFTPASHWAKIVMREARRRRSACVA